MLVTSPNVSFSPSSEIFKGRWKPARRRIAPRIDSVVPAPSSAPVSPDDLDRATVLAALEAHAWVIKDTWPALGLRSRHQLHRLMKKLDLG